MKNGPWIHYIRGGANKPLGLIVGYSPEHIGYSYCHPRLDRWSFEDGMSCATNRAFPNNKPAKIDKKTGKVIRSGKIGTKGGTSYNISYIEKMMNYYAIVSKAPDAEERHQHMLKLYCGLIHMFNTMKRVIEEEKEKIESMGGFDIDENQALKGD